MYQLGNVRRRLEEGETFRIHLKSLYFLASDLTISICTIENQYGTRAALARLTFSLNKVLQQRLGPRQPEPRLNTDTWQTARPTGDSESNHATEGRIKLPLFSYSRLPSEVEVRICGVWTLIISNLLDFDSVFFPIFGSLRHIYYFHDHCSFQLGAEVRLYLDLIFSVLLFIFTLRTIIKTTGRNLLIIISFPRLTLNLNNLCRVNYLFKISLFNGFSFNDVSPLGTNQLSPQYDFVSVSMMQLLLTWLVLFLYDSDPLYMRQLTSV